MSPTNSLRFKRLWGFSGPGAKNYSAKNTKNTVPRLPLLRNPTETLAT